MFFHHMIKRSVSISNPAHLRYDRRRLIICQNKEENSIPLEDLAVVILEHPQITITHSLLSNCAEAGVVIVGCDWAFLPISITFPLYGHTQSSLHIHAQIGAPLPARKKIWQSLIRRKIWGQALVLDRCWKNWDYLRALAESVKSWDPENIEAQAARYYWTTLFWSSFRRQRDGDIPNPWLNYWYAVLRASIARGVVWAGLNPALWVHHSNQFNPFNLVDDLIEPFRPLIDIEVYRLKEVYPDCLMSPEQKLPLLWILAKELIWNGQKLPIFTALSYMCASYRNALEGGEFEIPNYEIF